MAGVTADLDLNQVPLHLHQAETKNQSMSNGIKMEICDEFGGQASAWMDRNESEHLVQKAFALELDLLDGFSRRSCKFNSLFSYITRNVTLEYNQ